MTSDEEYVKCTAKVLMATRDAFMIESAELPLWIPFSLVHSADEMKIKRAMRGDVVSFRLMEWKARAMML